MKDREQIFCSIEYTMNFINGKWKAIILWHLSTEGTHRYSEIKKKLKNITHKMLSQQLKEMIENGLISRKEYPQVPPKVEYLITEEGLSLMNILNEMHKWGKERMNKI